MTIEVRPVQVEGPDSVHKVEPGTSDWFPVDRFDTRLLVFCEREDNGGTILVQDSWLTIAVQTQDGENTRPLDLTKRITLEKGSSITIERHAMPLIEVKHIPSD